MRHLYFKLHLCLMLLFSFNLVIAQNGAVIDFNKNEHDFGRFPEKKGPVSTIFTFTNKGKTPLVINQVIASCGCTSPEWTKSPVEPGKSGELKVTYNPAGRPGTFVKTITVLSNASNNRLELRIKGEVETPEILRAVQYPVIMGSIRLDKRSIQVGEINSSARFDGKLMIFNPTDKPLNIKFAGVPRHIKLTTSQNPLQPEQTGEILVSYDPSAIKDWGVRKDDFYILYNNETRMTSDRRITVSAIIKEDFSKLTQSQKENAPKIEVSDIKADFGSVSPGQKISKEIKIKNTGKSILHIRKITCGNPAIKPSINRMSIPAGSEATLNIQLDAASLRRAIAENMVVITNDPSRSSLPIRITATPNR